VLLLGYGLAACGLNVFINALLVIVLDDLI